MKFTLKGRIIISVNYSLQDQQLKVKVKDTGVGIKPDEKAKLFTLFGKLESAETINTKGIGLGLSICKKIVEACGGQIYLDHDYILGASFVFTMKANLEGHKVVQIKP